MSDLRFIPDADGYVFLGDVCRNYLGMQCQYGSRYADTLCSYLRIKGSTAEYHQMKIHKDDVMEYAVRVLVHRFKIGVINKTSVEALLDRLGPLSADHIAFIQTCLDNQK